MVQEDTFQDSGTPKRWFTIKEAADYLGISQPTLFRWMKEGTLSFYKVGGATRFSQEGLDAVIEKSTGEKEAQQAAGRCVACQVEQDRQSPIEWSLRQSLHGFLANRRRGVVEGSTP